MAGANGSAMAIAASEAGGLGSLPCAMLDAATVRAEMGVIRQHTTKPVNVNFLNLLTSKWVEVSEPAQLARCLQPICHRVTTID